MSLNELFGAQHVKGPHIPHQQYFKLKLLTDRHSLFKMRRLQKNEIKCDLSVIY